MLISWKWFKTLQRKSWNLIHRFMLPKNRAFNCGNDTKQIAFCVLDTSTVGVSAPSWCRIELPTWYMTVHVLVSAHQRTKEYIHVHNYTIISQSTIWLVSIFFFLHVRFTFTFLSHVCYYRNKAWLVHLDCHNKVAVSETLVYYKHSSSILPQHSIVLYCPFQVLPFPFPGGAVFWSIKNNTYQIA